MGIYAEKYRLKVYDSVLDFAHNLGHIIEEYIPELGIAINTQGVFKLMKKGIWRVKD